MGCGIRRILQFNNAVVYGPIKVLNESEVDVTNSCMYSWSSDGVCWTAWTNYAQYNLICQNIESDFYLRVLLFDGFSRISLNGLFTNCYTICIDSTSPFLQDFCSGTNLFNPYMNLDCAMQLYEQTANNIACMFGIPVYYLRVTPDVQSADYTFKEYPLHNVSDIKQIKLIVEDGQLPSSNPKFTELDFDWENDWEVEIGKRMFANAFGDEAFPKQRDLIYIPLLKRMYEVNSAYDEKNEGFMWRPVTWKLALVKYNEKTNVEQGEFESLIDGWVVNNYEDTFGKIERNEQEREVGATPLTAPRFSATNLCDIFMEDSVRKQYTKQDITIMEKQFNHRSTVVARNYYRFKNENACVTYQKGICGENGTLMFLLETQGTLEGALSKEIIQMGNISVDIDYDTKAKDFTLKFNKLACKLEQFTDYLVVCKWNRATFSSELLVYKYTHEVNIPIYKLRPEMYWFDFENPICTEVGAYNNDFYMTEQLPCQIHAYPVFLSNIRLYNEYLEEKDTFKELVKYTTQHEGCVINDLARPISSGRGFDVR